MKIFGTHTPGDYYHNPEMLVTGEDNVDDGQLVCVNISDDDCGRIVKVDLTIDQAVSLRDKLDRMIHAVNGL